MRLNIFKYNFDFASEPWLDPSPSPLTRSCGCYQGIFENAEHGTAYFRLYLHLYRKYAQYLAQIYLYYLESTSKYIFMYGIQFHIM